jgi:hypothetical protein
LIVQNGKMSKNLQFVRNFKILFFQKSIFLAFVLINSVLSAPNRHRRDTDIVFQEPLIAERTPRRFTEEESFLPLFRAPIFVPDTFVESREGVRILNPVHDEYGIPETTTTTTVA